MILDLLNVSIFSKKKLILNPFSLRIKHGEIILIVGPSGSGKSTLLNFIAGFIPIEKDNHPISINKWFAGSNTNLIAKGKLLYKYKDISELQPERRSFCMVNQKHSVYPHLTGLENIAFPLKCAGMDFEKRIKIAYKLAKTVQISKESILRKAIELSGGEQQRIAIAKLLAKNGDVGLLDESFSHLDPLLRKELTKLIFEIIKNDSNNYFSTALMVSHDMSDIQYADKVILIVDSCKHSENVIILNLEDGLFRTKSILDSAVKKQWVKEINNIKKNEFF